MVLDSDWTDMQKKPWTVNLLPFNLWFSLACIICIKYCFVKNIGPWCPVVIRPILQCEQKGTGGFFVLWLRDDNKTTMTVGVNIYAADFKGQTLVHVPLTFSHLQAEARAADVRKPLMWSETWRERSWGLPGISIWGLFGGKTNTSLYVSC